MRQEDDDSRRDRQPGGNSDRINPPDCASLPRSPAGGWDWSGPAGGVASRGERPLSGFFAMTKRSQEGMVRKKWTKFPNAESPAEPHARACKPARAQSTMRCCERERNETGMKWEGRGVGCGSYPEIAQPVKMGWGSRNPHSQKARSTAQGEYASEKTSGHFADLTAGFVVEADFDLNGGQRGEVVGPGPAQFSCVVDAIDPIVVAIGLPRSMSARSRSDGTGGWSLRFRRHRDRYSGSTSRSDSGRCRYCCNSYWAGWRPRSIGSAPSFPGAQGRERRRRPSRGPQARPRRPRR